MTDDIVMKISNLPQTFLQDPCTEKSAQPKKALRRKEDDEDIVDVAASGVIKTTKIDFEPERDELFAAVSEKRKRIQEMEERPKISSFRGPQKRNKVDIETENAGVVQQRKKVGDVQTQARLRHINEEFA